MKEERKKLISQERRNGVEKCQNIKNIKQRNSHAFVLTVFIKFPKYSFIIQTMASHDVHAAFQPKKLLKL